MAKTKHWRQMTGEERNKAYTQMTDADRQAKEEREEISRLVLGLLGEGATALHSFVRRYRPNLTHTIACLAAHQQYALVRLEWEEEKAIAGMHHRWGDIYSSSPSWRRMRSLGNDAFSRRLRLSAIHELMDATGVVPVTYGHWCKSVRNNDFDNFRSAGAIVDGMLYEASWYADGWTERNVVVNPDWDKETSCQFRTTVLRRSRQRSVPDAPVPAMLMIAIRAAFKESDSV